MWKYKLRKYLENRNEKRWKNIKIFAQNSVAVTREYLQHIESRQKFDMGKYLDDRQDIAICLRYILHDEEGAKKETLEMAKYFDPRRWKGESGSWFWREGMSLEELSENMLKVCAIVFNEMFH